MVLYICRVNNYKKNSKIIKMKTLKKLHSETSKTNKVGILILVTIILPLLVSISTKVLTTQNIIF